MILLRSLRTPRCAASSPAVRPLGRTVLATLGAAAAFVSFGLGASAALAQPSLEYNRDIRPILADNCFACHGPDSASRKAGLRIDQREAAIEAGALEPGDPESSEIYLRMITANPDAIMPPPASHKQLTTDQIATIRQWIEEGAEYQPHWSFIAPTRPALPEVRDAAWIRNPIDRFILARLEAEGLAPAPEADRRTLVRRLAFDLTGLPPTPELVAEFVADQSPEAYERLVDRLLESERWGEHRGRYWLDYARYADTHGIHFDNYREMWSYRDWVIGAFNRNLPWDEFTVESLAGDLLPNRTLEQQIGSGFNRCNMTTNEGGIIDEEYLVLYTRDRTETTSQVWLGLSANCATCHDHKFDPLSQREFYAMAAFFNNSTQGARDGNVKDSPPIVAVPLVEDRDRWVALQSELPAARQAVEARRAAARGEFDTWLEQVDPAVFASRIPTDTVLAAPLSEGEGLETEVTIDGAARRIAIDPSAVWQPGHVAPSGIEVNGPGIARVDDFGDFEADEALTVAAWVRLAANDGAGAIAAKMAPGPEYRGWDFWVQQRRVGMHLVGSWSNDALKVVTRDQLPADRWVHVLVSYDGSRSAEGVRIWVDGAPQATAVEANSLTGSIRNEVPFHIGQRSDGQSVPGLRLQDLRIWRRTLDQAEAASLSQSSRFASIVAKPNDRITAEEKDELYAWWLSALDSQFGELTATADRLQREQDDIRSRGTIAHVMEERMSEAEAFVLNRGEYDQRRDRVTADTPAILPPFPADAPRNRLGFARWLLLPEHPLTARVTVNRFWQEVFGTGIVRTAGDFGVAGELPSHPELLDWLAVDFRESGWDVKRLFKTMVMSAAYRQSAAVTSEKLERDPANRLLSRGPRFRMDAEMIRDAALASSGLLVGKIGGPSVKPYQPPGVWEAIAMNVSNTRSYEADQGEGLYRRSMYTFWKRMAPPASMDIFNAPTREYCVVRRERTNTPLQALATLNDEQFLEAARYLAQQALEAESTFEGRVAFVAHRVVARDFRPEELDVIRDSLARLETHYAAHPDDAAALLEIGHSPANAALPASESAAWTMLVNQLMNLDEVLNK